MWSAILATGILLFVIGTLATLLNFYLSFLRFPLHLARGGTAENYRFISGLPMFGSLSLWISAPLLSAHPVAMWSALILSLLDTAGLHWFVGTMLYYSITHTPPNSDGRAP
jgi:hypothetical protein